MDNFQIVTDFTENLNKVTNSHLELIFDEKEKEQTLRVVSPLGDHGKIYFELVVCYEIENEYTEEDEDGKYKVTEGHHSAQILSGHIEVYGNVIPMSEHLKLILRDEILNVYK